MLYAQQCEASASRHDMLDSISTEPRLGAEPMIRVRRGSEEEVPDTLSLASVFAYTDARSLQLLEEAERVEEIIQEARILRARLLPRVEAHASWNRRVEAERVGVVNNREVYTTTGPFERTDLRLLGEFVVFDLNRWHDWKAQQGRVRMAEWGEEILREQLYAMAALLSFELALEAEILEAREGLLEQTRALHILTLNQVEGGLASNLDRVRSASRLVEDEERVHAQRSLVFQTALRLESLLDLTQNTRVGIDLHDPLSRQELLVPERVGNLLLEDEVGLISLAFDRRLDLARVREEWLKDEKVRDAAQAKRYPTLRLEGYYARGAQTFTNAENTEEWRIMALVSVPLFEGFAIDAQVRRADARMRATAYVHEALENQIRKDVLSARNDLQTAASRLELVNRRVGYAEEELALATSRFRGGIADNQEVIDGLTQSARSRVEQAENRFAYRRALLNLALSLGDIELVLMWIE